MKIVEVRTGKKWPVIVRKVENKDFRLLTVKRFSFSWRRLRNQVKIDKLERRDHEGILGVLGLVDWPEEKRIEIKLLASSIENI